MNVAFILRPRPLFSRNLLSRRPLSRRPISLPLSSLSQRPTPQMPLPVNGIMDQRMDFVMAKIIELNKSVAKIDVQLWYLNAGVGGICIGGLMLLG
ncbi:hypothetical protein TWF679_005300 [Orbilia oligospora]|uniref:Uncharacterized protein n=2 Tax=Orbilia oligospora TaxID=2813651 RepID=A0A8H8VCF0_ORBOL|nr:hypothetical protein TWF679_005300 [Orbilia oligospora]